MITPKFIIPAMLLTGLPAMASDSDAQYVADTVGLKEVQVIETMKAPVALLPLDVKVVSEQTIQKSAQTNLLPVLRNHVPGMFVTERGMSGFGVSGGAAGTVNIRGVGQGNKVLFLIDGQPQWAGVFGHSLPDTYVTNDVERVEVVSGPSSLLYGSGAMGGSVNIITKHATQDGFSGSANLMWGSYGTQKYAAKVGYKHNRFNAFVAANYERSDGHRSRMSYWLANQFASLSYDINTNWQVGGNVTLTETKAHNPGSVYEPLYDMWTKVFRTTASIYVKDHYEKSSGGIQAYYNYGRHHLDDGHTAAEQPKDYLFNSKDYNAGITAYQTVNPWEGNDLSLGIDYKQWGGKTWNEMKNGDPNTWTPDKHVDEIGAYVMTQQALLNDMLSVNAGVRLEHSSQFGNEWVPQAGFIFNPLPASKIKFSYGKGFRSPNIRELYMYPPHNPDLKPERMNNFEVELRQYLLDSRLNVGLALYYINGENLIQTVRTDGRPLNVNTGKFINKGFEIDASFDINSQWAVTANYAYLHTDTRIVAAPKNKLFGELTYRPGKWSFTLESLSIWGMLTEETEENYSLLNLRASYDLDIRGFIPVTLFAKVDNITDAKYQINYGFPMPGVTFMAGFNLKF
ncbi:MAG: TonB-dependent receptor [Muribaculum sp.]|nr:TonB-dependent receptor [Muribaculum sp.]